MSKPSAPRTWTLTYGIATHSCPKCGKAQRSKEEVIIAVGPAPKSHERILVQEVKSE